MQGEFLSGFGGKIGSTVTSDYILLVGFLFLLWNIYYLIRGV